MIYTYYQNYVVFTRIALTIRSVYDMIVSIKGKYTYTRGRRIHMELHRYDTVEAELCYGTGSIQKKRRPYIIVSNEKGTTNASIITVMPLTHIIKSNIFQFMDVYKRNQKQDYLLIQ